jgi:hypothetical protein
VKGIFTRHFKVHASVAMWVTAMASLCLALSACKGGNTELGGGLFSDVTLPIQVSSGAAQVQARGLYFDQPVVFRVSDTGTGLSAAGMKVNFRQVSATDAVVESDSAVTDENGFVQTRVRAPTIYNQTVVVEASLDGSNSSVRATLYGVSDTPRIIEFVAGNLPPSSHQASPVTPIASFKVQIKDAFGYVIDTNSTDSILLSAGPPSVGVVTGTTSATLASGISTFSNAIYTKAETLHLRATHPGTGLYAEVPINVYHGPADHLTFTTQPTDPTIAGAPITPVVTIRDISENTVLTGADSTAVLTLSKVSGTGTLSGTLTRTAVAGVADFSTDGLSIDTVGLKRLRIDKPDLSGSGGQGALTTDSINFNVNSATAVKLRIAGSASINTGDCEPYTVNSLDAFDNVSGVGAPTTVSLTGQGASANFFSTNACTAGTELTSFTLATGTATKAVWYRTTVGPQALTFGVDDGPGGLAAGTLAVTINVNAAHHLALTGIAAVKSGICTGPYTVTVKDAFSNDRNVGVDLNVLLSGGSTQFYDTAGCAAAAVTSVTVTTGTAAKQFYIKDAVAEALAITADDGPGGLLPDTFNSVVSPDRLDLTGPAQVRANDCSLFTVTSRDTALNAANLVTTSTFNLSSTAGTGVFYAAADTTCSGAAITTGTISAGAQTTTFRYKDSTAAAITLSVADQAAYLLGDTQAVTVGPRLVQVTGPSPVRSGDCDLYTLTTRDGNATAANVLSATTFNLDDGPGAGLYYAAADTTCSGGAVTTATIASGASTTTVRYKNATAANVTLSATDAAALLDPGTLAIVNGPRILDLQGSGFISASACAPFTVTSRDAAGAAAAVLSATTMNFSGVSSGQFYVGTDTTCAGAPITSQVLAAGQSLMNVRYKNATAETVTLAVADQASLLIGSTLTTVVGPSKLDLSGPSSLRANECGVFSVAAVDVGGTPANVQSSVTVNLTQGAASGAYYAAADTTCSGGAITSVTIAGGTSTQGLRYKDPKGESITLTATDNAAFLTADTQAVAIGPDRLILSGASPIRAGDCVTYSFVTNDALSNATGVLAPTPITLDDGATGGLFYASTDATCAAAPITQVSLIAGASAGSFKYQNAAAQTVTLNIDDGAGGMTSSSRTVVVGPRKLKLTGPAQLSASACALLTVTSQDQNSAAAAVLSNTTVQVDDGSASGLFYVGTDTTCAGAPITSATIASGTSSVNVRYKDTLAESVTVTATDAAALLDPSSLSFSIGPDRLTIAGPSPTRSGDCSVYTVTARDSLGNPASVLAAHTIQVADSTTHGLFYASGDTTCSGATLTSVPMAIGDSSFTVHFKTLVAENLTLSAADGSSEFSTGTLAVTSGPRSITVAGASSVRASDCSLMTITTRDAAGTAANVLSATQVNVDDGVGSGLFYAAGDTTCAGAPVTSAIVASGTQTIGVRYKDTKAENVTLAFNDQAALLVGATKSVAVGASRLHLTGTTPIRAGDCVAYTVTSEDETATPTVVGSNTQVNLSDASASGIFYASTDTTCAGGAVTNITIASGTSSKVFYYKDDVAETLTLNAADNAAFLSTSTLGVVVGPRSLIPTGPSVLQAGACGLFTVTSRDAASNAAGVLTSTTVNLDDAGKSGDFYAAADTTCAGAPISSVTLAATVSSTTFRYKDAAAENVVVTTSDAASALVSGTTSFDVGGSRLVLTGASPIRSGDCTLYTATLQDENSVATNALSPVTISSLTDGSATGNFYAGTDTTCSGAIATSATISTGTSSTTIRWKDTVAESVTLTVDDGAGGLAAGSLAVVAGPRDLQLAGSTAIRAGDCEVYTITSRDAAGTAANVLSNRTINLADGTATGDFYAAGDTTCSGAIATTATIASGTSSTTVRYKTVNAEAITLAVADAGALLNSTTLAVNAGPNHYMLTGPSPILSGACSLYTVTTKDAAGASANALSALTVDLTDGTPTGTFYAAADTTCSGGAITQTIVASGSSSSQFRWKNTAAASSTLTADDGAGGLDPGTLTVVTGPDHLLLTGTTTIRAGDCSAFTVTAKDNGLATANVLSATTVNLTNGAASGLFYASADTTCSGGPVTSVSIASGASSQTLYYRDNVTEASTLTASDNAASLASATLALNIGLRKLKLTGPSPLVGGQCALYTITTQDANGLATNTASNVTVTLADGAALGQFYAAGDTTCSGGAITTAVVSSGTSSKQVRYRDDKAESLTLSIADQAALLDPDSLAIVVGPDHLILTGTSPIRAGDCSLYTLTSKDAAGNSSNVLSNTTVNFADGAGSGLFYDPADSTCSGGAITSRTLLAGSNTTTLRYRDAVAESVVLTGDDGGGLLASASLPVVVGPNHLVLTGASPIRSGDCTAYTVTAKDVNNTSANALSAITVNVANGAGSGAFYATADTTCSGGTVTSVTLASGTSSVVVYYKDQKAESVTLTAADNAASLTSSSLPVVLGPRDYQLTGTTPIRAGDCTLLTVTTKDAAGTTANALSLLNINVLTDGTATGDFYAAGDTTCAGGPITSVSIASGASTTQLRWRDTKSESVTLSVDDGAGGLNAGTFAVTAGPDRLILTGASPIRSSDCTVYTITSRDVDGNAANVLSSTTVNLTKGATSGVFYAAGDTTCSGGAVTTATIASGTNSTTFRYADSVAETATLTATDAAASLTASNLTVVTGPLKYIITGTSPILSGTCTLYTVTTKDAANNTANALSALSLTTLTDGTATGDFYAPGDTTCSGGTISSLAISSGTSSTTFRWKDTTAEAITLTADDGAGGLNPGTLAVTVGPDRLTIAGATTIRSGDCTPYVITSRDTALNAANVLGATTVTLADGSAAGDFYVGTDTTCSGGTITTTTIASGTNNVTVYYKDPTAEAITLNASSAPLSAGTLAINAGPQGFFITGTSPIRANDCSLYTITTKDAAGVAANVLSTVTVSSLVDGSATGNFYAAADTTCSGGTVSSLSVTSGTSTVQFRYKDNVGESLTLTVDDGAGGLNAGTFALTVGPDRLTIAGNSPIRAGDCEIYTITSRDAAANAKNVTVATQVNLDDGVATGLFYAIGDTTCTGGTITSANIASGASSVQVRYKDNKAESLTLSAADNASYLSTGTLAVVDGPRYYQLTGSSPIRAGDCSLYTITTKDQNGTTANAVSALSVNALTDGTATGNFYAAADTTCSGGAITSVAIANGASTGTFRWMDTTAESITLTVDDGAGGLDPGTLGVVVGPSKITISGTSPIRANDCSIYTVTIRDTANNAANVLSNTTVNINDGAAAGNFYAAGDTTCSGGTISSVSILAGSNTATYRYKDATGESLTMNADDSVAYLASGTLPLVIGPDHLVLTGASPIRSGDCTVYTITSQDANSVAANVTAASIINLTDAAAAGNFYASGDTTCTGGVITTATIASGTSSITFRYMDNTAESLTLNAAHSTSYLSTATLPVVVGPRKYVVTGTTPILSNQCSLYTVTTKDMAGATANALSNLSITTMTDGSATGDFFAASDTTCSGGVISSLSIASGTSTAQFRWRDTVGATQTLTIDDGAGGLDPGTLAVTVGPDHFSLTGNNPIRSGDCEVYTVTTKDTANNTVNATSLTTVNISDATAAGVFYAAGDTTCTGGAISSVSIASGASSTTFRYRDDTAESLTLTAADNAAAITTATKAVVVGPQKYIVTGSSPIRAGDCSLYTVTTKDAAGATANALSALTLNSLTDGSATGDFYAAADTTCSGGAVSSLAIASGGNTVQFRYKDTVGAALTLTIDDGAGGLNAGTFALTIGPDHLKVTGNNPIRSGDCEVYTVTSRDVAGNAVNVTGATTVNLSDAAAAGNFYAAGDTTCSGGIVSTATIANGTSSTTFRYLDSTAESLTISIADNASYLTGDSLAINNGPRTYQLTGPTPIRAGDCSVYTITTKDAAGATANALSALTINALTDGTATGNFYAAGDTTCSGGTITSVSIASGANTTTLRWSDTTAESVTLTVDDGAGGLNPGSTAVVVGPNRLVLSGATPIRSGDCTQYTVTSKDVAGNAKNVLSATTVNLTDTTATGNFYGAADATCSGGTISTVSIASGASAATFYYKDPVAESITVTATDNAAYLTASNLAISVGPQYYLLTGASPIRANECTLYTITTKDNAGNTANALSALSVNSLVDGTATGDFYAAGDTTCAGAPITSVAIASGASSGTFRWKDSVAATRTLTVDDGVGGLNAGSLAVIVGPDRLNIQGNNVLALNTCGPFTITARDAALNAANVLSNTTVNLTDGTATGDFYDSADTTCSGATITSKQILSGANTVTVNYKDSVKEIITLGADDNAAYLTSSSMALEVGSDHFTVSGPAQVRAGDCTVYTVTTMNASEIPESVLANSNVTLSDAAATGIFYAIGDTTCSGGAISTITITTGTSSAQYRYKDVKAEAVTFTVDDGAGGRNPGTFPLSVGPDHIVIAGASNPSINTCVPYTITTQDQVPVNAGVLNATTLNLSTTGSGQFFDVGDSTCAGAPITTLNYASAASSKIIYYRDAVSESVTMTAADQAALLTTGTLTTEVGADRLALTGPTPILAGTCQIYTVTSQNAALAAQNVLANTTVTLANVPSAGVFYALADTTCSGGAITTATIASGTSSISFRYKDLTAQTPTLTGTSPGRTSASLAIVVGPDRLKLTGAVAIAANACTLYTITTQDANSTAANALSTVTVNLSGAGSGAFYAAGDTTCSGGTVTTASVTSGTSSVQFRYKNATAQSVTLSAADNAAVLSTSTLAVGVGPSQLVVTGASPIRGGDCTPYTITTKDATSTVANALATLTINLTKGASAGAFYAAGDSTCAGGTVTTTTITSGTSARTVYFKDNTAEAVTLSAADSGAVLTTGTLAITVGARKLTIAGATSNLAGACVPYTITSKDNGGVTTNVASLTTVNLSGGGAAGSFYASGDTTCSGGAITSTTIASGSATATVRYRDNSVEAITLTVTDNASYLDPGTLAIATTPDRLKLTGPTSMNAGTCGLYTVTSQDAGNVAANVAANVTVNLNDGAAPGVFYASADTTCVGGAISSIVILSGSNSKQFRYKSNTAGSATLNADDNAGIMTSSTLTVVVGASKLVLTGSASPGSSLCVPYTITAQDVANNPVNVLSTVTVNLTDGSPSGNFYASGDSTCAGGTVTSTSITSGTSAVTVYYKDPTLESLTLSAADAAASLTTGTLAVTVIDSCPVDHYLVEVMSGGSPVTTIPADQSFAVRLTAKTAGNVTQSCLNTAKTIAWTMNAASGTADCGAGSAVPVAPSQTSLTFSSGVVTSSVDALFTVKEAAAKVQLSDGIAAGTSANINVTAGAACRVRIMSASNNAGADVTTQSIGLNATGATGSSSFSVYAAGFDKYGNYVADQTVVWSGDAIVNPIAQTTTSTNDTAVVTGVKVGAGTLQADLAGGGGAKTDTVAVTVTSANSLATWGAGTTDLAAKTFLGSATVQDVKVWDVSADAVNAWRTSGTQSWFSEAFSATRGARAEFPSRVFLVSTASGLDVIDVTSNRLFMRFSMGANFVLDSTYGSVVSAIGLNGKIFALQRNASTTGTLTVIDLENDVVKRYTTGGEFTRTLTIAARNSAGAWSSSNATPSLASNLVYSLDARRIGAIDYVLVGTASGASLYQNNAGAISMYSHVIGKVTATRIASSGKLYYAEDAVGLRRADVSLPLASSFTSNRMYDGNTNAEVQSLTMNDISLAEGMSTAGAGENIVLVATTAGVSAIHENAVAVSSQSVGYSYKGSGQTAFGGALSTDGSSSTYAQIPSNGTTLGPAVGNTVTVEFWFRPDATVSSGLQYLYSRGSGNGSVAVRLNGGKLEFDYTTNAGVLKSVQSTASSFTGGVWHHFAGTITGTGITMWTDGADQKNLAATLTSETLLAGPTNLAADSAGTNLFIGAIDELRVSSSTRYSTATFAVPSSAFANDGTTVNLLHFDEGTGVTAGYADTNAQRSASLGGNARLMIPILAGTSDNVGGVDAVVSGGSLAVETISSGGAGAWSELFGVNTGSATLNTSITSVNGLRIRSYHVDAVGDSDVIFSTTTGVQLKRR